MGDWLRTQLLRTIKQLFGLLSAGLVGKRCDEIIVESV